MTNIQPRLEAQSYLEQLLPKKLSSKESLSQKQQSPESLEQLFKTALEGELSDTKINDLIDRITYAKDLFTDNTFDRLAAAALSQLKEAWKNQKPSEQQITSTLQSLEEKLDIKGQKIERYTTLKSIFQEVFIPSSTPKALEGKLLSGTVRKSHKIYEQTRKTRYIALGAIALLAGSVAGIYMMRPTGEGTLVPLHTATPIPTDLVEAWQMTQEEIKQMEQNLTATIPPLLQEQYSSYEELTQALEKAESLLPQTEEAEHMAAEFWTQQEMSESRVQLYQLKNNLETRLSAMKAQEQSFKNEAHYLHEQFEYLQNISANGSHLARTRALYEQIQSSYASKLPPSKMIGQLREVEKQCDQQVALAKEQYHDVKEFCSYAEKQEPSLHPLAPTSSDLSLLEERARQNLEQAENIRELAATKRASKETEEIKSTVEELGQTGERVQRAITEPKVAEASQKFIELMRAFPPTEDNEQILRSIQENTARSQQASTPEEAVRIEENINTDIERLQSWHDLYNIFSQTLTSFRGFNNIQLNEMAEPYTEAAQEWGTSLQTAQGLRETASQSFVPVQLVREEAPPETIEEPPHSLSLEELDKSMETLRSLLNTVQGGRFNPSPFLGLISKAQESFSKLQEGLKREASPNEVYTLFQQAKETLQSTLEQLNTMTQTISAECSQSSQLVNTTATTFPQHSPEWDRAFTLATTTNDLLNTQSQILQSSELLQQYLAHTEEMLKEYTSFAGQFRAGWEKASESYFNSAVNTIASKTWGIVKSLFGWSKTQGDK